MRRTIFSNILDPTLSSSKAVVASFLGGRMTAGAEGTTLRRLEGRSGREGLSGWLNASRRAADLST
jgi:hypothetical protein